jgi:hypothetical protein
MIGLLGGYEEGSKDDPVRSNSSIRSPSDGESLPCRQKIDDIKLRMINRVNNHA